MRNKLSTVSGLLSLTAAVGVGLWQAIDPCIYSGFSETQLGEPPGEPLCVGSLVAINGTGIIWVLTIPVILILVGLLALYRNKRPGAVVAVILLLAFCVLGLASIGSFYLPSALLLVLAAASSRREAES